jgi:hypothetical protein
MLSTLAADAECVVESALGGPKKRKKADDRSPAFLVYDPAALRAAER